METRVGMPLAMPTPAEGLESDAGCAAGWTLMATPLIPLTLRSLRATDF